MFRGNLTHAVARHVNGPPWARRHVKVAEYHQAGGAGQTWAPGREGRSFWRRLPCGLLQPPEPSAEASICGKEQAACKLPQPEPSRSGDLGPGAAFESRFGLTE